MAEKVPVVGDGNGRVSKAQATRIVGMLISAAAIVAALGYEVPWLSKLAEKPGELIVLVGGFIAGLQSLSGYFDRQNRLKETKDAVKAAE